MRRPLILAPLDERTLLVRGQPKPLRVGMTDEARCTPGSNALIEDAFELIRQLRGNLMR